MRRGKEKAMTVHFTINGEKRTERVATSNANFAREAVETRYPGARVWLILARPR